MSDDDVLGKAKSGVEIISAVLKTAGDSPNVKEAANNLGKTAVIVTKTINNALLPLAAINFAFDKARDYFNTRFEKDLADKAAQIPADKIIEPKPSVAGPTLQGLAFTHQEQDLKEMYLNLLATAMDSRVAEKAHPAFVELIKQLDAEEAVLLKTILSANAHIPIVQVRKNAVGVNGGYELLQNHLMSWTNSTTGAIVEKSRTAAMVDNWIRLGLIQVSYSVFLTNEHSYDWVEHRPEFAKLKEEHDSDLWKVGFQRGIIQRTEFGLQFALAVGLAQT